MLIAVKTDVNNVVVSYAVVLNNDLNYEGALIETDLDLDLIQLVGNYKVADGVLVELAEEEKQTIETKPTVSQRIAVLQEKISVLQTQVPLQISELEAQICELVFADMEGDED